MAGEHVGEQTHGEDKRLDPVADHFNYYDHRHDEQSHLVWHVHVRDVRFQIAADSHLGNRSAVDHRESAKRQHASHRDTGSRRATVRYHAEQIAEKNEEKECPNERQKAVGIVLADVRFGNFLPEESEQRFEGVEAEAWRWLAAARPTGKWHKDDND